MENVVLEKVMVERVDKVAEIVETDADVNEVDAEV